MPNRAQNPYMGSWAVSSSQFENRPRRNSEITTPSSEFQMFTPPLAIQRANSEHVEATQEYSTGREDIHKTHASQYILYNYLTTGEKVSSRYPNDPVGQSTERNSVHVKEVPTWKIYYTDQRARDRLVKFSIPQNHIIPNDYLNKSVSLCFNDVCIAKLAVDAVVNCTTENYALNDGATSRCILNDAGNSLHEACQSLPRLEVGEVQITPGFNLPAKYVIHTNGPYREEDATKLKNCYENALKLLLQCQLRTIAFPCISTGLKRMNRETAANVALKTVRDFLEANSDKIDRVIFSLHNPTDIVIYRRFMQIYFPIDGGG